jgi:site-specific recombinase XerD
MLDLYYQYPKVLQRLRGGALGDQMDHIAARLAELGYKPSSAKIYLEGIARFSRFAAWVGCRQAATIGQEVIDRFLRATTTRSARITAQTAVGHARVFAAERFTPVSRREPCDPHAPLLAAYAEHLRQVRGLQSRTCEGLLLAARRVLEWHQEHRPGQPLSRITGEDVLALVHHFLSLHANASTRCSTTSHIRSFLRFLRWSGLNEEDLARFVPRTPCRRMAQLPARLAWNDVGRVIGAIDATNPVGMRDRAMLLLLATTGLRNKELRSLVLQDVRWRAGEVLLRRTKTHRARVVPLLPEAGAALAEYVLFARPKIATTRLFLCHTPPVRPLDSSATVSRIIRSRLERCALRLPWAGAHLLRHSLATRLVAQQRPIKEVADLLGHQSIDTTAIYVKVALSQLATVALPFPGGQS